MTITTYDAATGITTEEELSEELAAERAAELQAIEDSKKTTENKRKEILTKLGITEDEAKLLLS